MEPAAPPRTAAAGTSERRLGFGPVIAVYLGLLLVLAASVSLLVIYWDSLGATGVLALAVVYLTGYLGAAEVLRRRGLTQPADVLEAVAVGWVGLATYAILELSGVWPEGASGLGRVHVGLTTIAVIGLAASLLLLALRPDPLLFVPMAAATGVLAVDLAEAVFGRGIDDLSSRQIGAFVLPVGMAWIAIGLWLDVTRRRPLRHVGAPGRARSHGDRSCRPRAEDGARVRRHRRPRRARAVLLSVRATLELHRDRRSRRPHGHAVGGWPPRGHRTARDRRRRDRLDLRRVALVALARVDPKRHPCADAGGSTQLHRSPFPVVATPRAAARSARAPPRPG